MAKKGSTGKTEGYKPLHEVESGEYNNPSFGVTSNTTESVPMETMKGFQEVDKQNDELTGVMDKY